MPQIIKVESEHTVLYKERFLYSKRCPSQKIEALVSSVEPLERHLYIFASPVLGYGAWSLIKKLPSSSFVIFVECDKELSNVFEEHFLNTNVALLNYIYSEDIASIITYIEKITKFNFKSASLIRGSAGFSLYEDFYNELLREVERVTSIFWKNRITLIEMGRLYAKNIFLWLRFILKDDKKRCKAMPKESVKKPILVLGAGPSLDTSYEFIKKNREKVFLLAVDAAFSSLSDVDIYPDAVVILEAQHWILDAFLTSNNRSIPLFASITSTPKVCNILHSDIFLYATEYASLSLLEELKTLLPNLPFFQPLGSVGLQILAIALFIAKKNIPILHTGLDFSWQKGYTHAKSSFKIKNILSRTNKLNSLYSLANVCSLSSHITSIGKDNKKLSSTPILQNYATLYKKVFAPLPNIFDIAPFGLHIKDRTLKNEDAQNMIDSYSNNFDNNIKKCEYFGVKELRKLLSKEKENLCKLKKMLVGDIPFDFDTASSIIKNSKYLYIHFPDYIDFSSLKIQNLSFLKRIRIELEFFLKIINIDNLY